MKYYKVDKIFDYMNNKYYIETDIKTSFENMTEIYTLAGVSDELINTISSDGKDVTGPSEGFKVTDRILFRIIFEGVIKKH